MSAALPTWLFAAYGGGHVRALLPVATRARDLGLAHVLFLGLTTAAREVSAAALPLLRYSDLAALPGMADPQALAVGRRLAAGLDIAAVDLDESSAYLGLNYAELVHDHGEQEAGALYARFGRQIFNPRALMRRWLQTLRPDLVVCTSAPRTERALLQAAGDLGLPSACVVDLFALDEIAWIGQSGFASRVCVLNEAVRQHLIEAGRTPGEVHVTGNPAFDALADPRWPALARQWRQAHGLTDRHVVLFASGLEQADHPMRPGVRGDPQLPRRIAAQISAFASAQAGHAAVIRPHPSEGAQHAGLGLPMTVCGQDVPVEVAVHVADTVVVIASTVAVQAALCGRRVIQVRGGLFEQTAPFVRFGFAQALVSLDELPAALAHVEPGPAAVGAAPSRRVDPPMAAGGATARVTDCLAGLAG